MFAWLLLLFCKYAIYKTINSYVCKEVKTVENTQNATSAQKPEVPEMRTIEIPEQNKTFEQAKLTGTQKFNYNNLQKAYAPKLQAQQVFVNQVA